MCDVWPRGVVLLCVCVRLYRSCVSGCAAAAVLLCSDQYRPLSLAISPKYADRSFFSLMNFTLRRLSAASSIA